MIKKEKGLQASHSKLTAIQILYTKGDNYKRAYYVDIYELFPLKKKSQTGQFY